MGPDDRDDMLFPFVRLRVGWWDKAKSLLELGAVKAEERESGNHVQQMNRLEVGI